MKSPHSQRSFKFGKALTGDNLAGDFGAGTPVAREGVRALYDAARSTRPAAMSQWGTLLGEASGRDPRHLSAAIEKLAACYGVGCAGLEPAALLFALHTYFALPAKLIAGEVIALSCGSASPVDGLLRAKNDRQRRQIIKGFEIGETFREVGLAHPFCDDPFSWYTDAWSRPIGEWTGHLAGVLAQYDPQMPPDDAPDDVPDDASDDGDLLKRLYQGLFPRSVRHRLGEYYTPGWLAGHVLDQVGCTGDPGRRLLDPTCGSGTFLVMAIRRMRSWHAANRRQCGFGPRELCRRILTGVVGLDLNPVAVTAARANYLVAMAALLPEAGPLEIPVYLCDSILGDPKAGVVREQFDQVVGNPPWITWDHLPAEYREATKPLWEQYGLFSLSGSEARHGGGKKDLSMLILFRSADRYLEPGGHLAMVITQTLFQTKGAGDGFRRFRLGPDGERLNVLRVDDMVRLRPFDDAANWTSTILLQKGGPTEYPVPYYQWSSADPPAAGRDDTQGQFVRRRFHAEPIDPARPGSPWFLRPDGFEARLEDLVGPSDYAAHLGANSGGANGVYWLQILGKARGDGSGSDAGGVRIRNIASRGKRAVETVEDVVDPELLYPLIRWADVTRYHAAPSAHILLVQDVHSRAGIDPAVLRRDYPRTWTYLSRFERPLKDRAALGRYQSRHAFYSMYNVGTYTIAPIKVVWRRMDRRINAAVVSEVDDPILGRRAAIPQETCVLIACDSAEEAHYVCAVLNSLLVSFLVVSHSVRGGKGFGTPGMLDFIKLRRFDPEDARHRELAQCSRQAHEAAAAGDVPDEIPQRIDRLTAELWGLHRDDLTRIAHL